MDVGCEDGRDLKIVEPARITDQPSAEPLSSAKPVARFAFVDGLRGLAALGVVLFHIWIYEPRPWPALESAHWVVDEAFRRARDGVQILLVISGFVIAYTLRKTRFSAGEAFCFMLRRVVRLVPAYWLILSLILLLASVCQLAGLPLPYENDATVPRITAHLVFLQDVLGYSALSAGIWTLCIEMQFYLVAILGWGAAQRLFPRRQNPPLPSGWGLLVVFGPPALVALFYWRKLDSTDPWVIHFLWSFFIGMLTWWSLDGLLPRWVFYSVIVIGCLDFLDLSDLLGHPLESVDAGPFEARIVANSKWSWHYKNGVALLTALAIFAAGRLNKLDVWLNWRPVQYLGTISYSLYLVHFPVFHLLTSVGWKWCGNAPTSLQARLILLSVIPASIVAGHLLYVLVEAPSARWSARMKNWTFGVASTARPVIPPDQALR